MDQIQPTATGAWARGLFIAACVVCFLTFAAHSAAHLRGPGAPQNDTERQLVDLMSSYKMALPGGSRTMMELYGGFSWHYAVSFLGIAAVGAAILPRAKADPSLLRLLSILFAGTTGVYLAISIMCFFLIPTTFAGLATVLFIAAAWASPGRDTGVRAA